jgi:nucleoside-triphosphatase THEP1
MSIERELIPEWSSYVKKMEAFALKANCCEVIDEVIATGKPMLITIKRKPIVKMSRSKLEENCVVLTPATKRKKK